MDSKVIRSYKGKGTKELQTFIQPGTAHYILKYEGGGELPEELSGVYTSLSLVDEAVLRYISNSKEEPKKKSISKEEE
jgi:hypothetical protein